MYKRPEKCVHPDCFHCVYPDCIWDGMSTSEFYETNKRDADFHLEATGNTYHVGELDKKNKTDLTTRQKNNARRKAFYQRHRDEILKKQKENYNKEKQAEIYARYWRKHGEEQKAYKRAKLQEQIDEKVQTG